MRSPRWSVISCRNLAAPRSAEVLRPALVVLLVVGAFVVSSTGAYACSITEVPSLEEELADGAVVFRAEAVYRESARSDRSGPLARVTDGDWVVLAVSAVGAGEVEARVAVLDMADGESNSCGGQAFYVGERYVVVAKRYNPDDAMFPYKYEEPSMPTYLKTWLIEPEAEFLKLDDFRWEPPLPPSSTNATDSRVGLVLMAFGIALIAGLIVRRRFTAIAP